MSKGCIAPCWRVVTACQTIQFWLLFANLSLKKSLSSTYVGSDQRAASNRNLGWKLFIKFCILTHLGDDNFTRQGIYISRIRPLNLSMCFFVLARPSVFQLQLHWFSLPLWQRSFLLWQRASPSVNSNWGRKRKYKRPNWLDKRAWLGISSEQLPCCGKGTCHGFQGTIGSATTEIRTFRELGLHTFILRTSLFVFKYNSSM